MKKFFSVLLALSLLLQCIVISVYAADSKQIDSIQVGTNKATLDFLTNTTWTFSRSNGSVISTQMKLNKNGKIEGYSHPNEYSWSIKNNKLSFYNTEGKKSTEFYVVKMEKNRLVLVGDYLLPKEPVKLLHILTSNDIFLESGTVPITSKELTENTWRFYSKEGTITYNFQFSSNGLISGYSHENEHKWKIVGKNLVVYGKNGKPTTVYKTFKHENGKWTMIGDYVKDGAYVAGGLSLQEVDKLPIPISELTNKEWKFARSDSSVITNSLKLLPNGTFSGSIDDNETYWKIENNSIVVMNSELKVTTVFNIFKQESGQWAIIGDYVKDGANKKGYHLLISKDFPRPSVGMYPVLPIYKLGESVQISAIGIACSQMEVFVNGESVYSQDGKELKFSYKPNAAGKYVVFVRGKNIAGEYANSSSGTFIINPAIITHVEGVIPFEYQGFKVKIMDAADVNDAQEARANAKVLAEVETDSQGKFETDIINETTPSAENGSDLFIRIEVNDNILDVVRVEDETTFRDCRFDSGIIRNCNESKVNFGQIKLDDDMKQALNIWYWVHKGHDYYQKNTKDGENLPKIRFGLDTEPAGYANGVLGFILDVLSFGDYPEITINSDYNQGSVILHEYGHFIMDHAGASPSVIGGAHTLNEKSNEKLAYSEAWASFFSCAVRNDPWMKIEFNDGTWYGFNLESGQYKPTTEKPNTFIAVKTDGTKERYNENAMYEVKVAQVLWDLFDSNEDGADKVCVPFKQIDDVMRSKNKSIYDFYDNWFKKGYAAEIEKKSWLVFDHMGAAHDFMKPLVGFKAQVSNGILTCTGSAEDDVAIEKIEWILDGKLLSTQKAQSLKVINYISYQHSQKLLDGKHTLQIRVYDTEGVVHGNMLRSSGAYSEQKIVFGVVKGKFKKI